MQPRLSANPASNNFFLIAFGLINILAFTLLLSTVSLLAGATIGKWQLPLACVLALAVNYLAANFLKGKLNSFFIKSSVVIAAVIFASILFAGYFYDLSFDGQWYHQQTVYQLKQGYNPSRQNLAVPPDEQLLDNSNNWCIGTGQNTPNFIKNHTISQNLKYININYFSKGTEIIEGAFYVCTNRIETAKAVNEMMLAASFFLCLSLLYKIEGIGIGNKWLLAFLLAFNPVTVNELLSFCVDGFGAGLLLCLLIVFCLLLIEQNKFYWLLLGTLIILVVNVKFTTLVFTGMFCFGFLIVLLVYKKMSLLKGLLITGPIAAFIGIFCCGFNPYVVNTVQKHNIFYGITETREEIVRLTPSALLNQNRFQKLFYSIASHQGTEVTDVHPVVNTLKVPFTFNKSDILMGTDSEPCFSGFGPFFSGALLIAIVVFVIAMIYFRKTQPFKLAGAALLIILSTIIIMPESWWMRFVPQLWLVPIIILVMAQFIVFRGRRILTTILYAVTLLNIAWSMLIIVFTLYHTLNIDYQMQQLRVLNKPVSLQYCNYRNFKTNGIRFAEAGIRLGKTDTGKYFYNLPYSTTKLATPVPLPQLPKSSVLKLFGRLLGKEQDSK